MPKINVYLPDDLAEAVRETGVPVSTLCQRALEQAVRRIGAVRTALADAGRADGGGDTLQFDRLTPRAASALARARAEARAADAPDTAVLDTGHLLLGVLAEPANLALQVLEVLEVDRTALRHRLADEAPDPAPAAAEPEAAFTPAAAAALEAAVTESLALGHNYLGCEHLLMGLAAGADGRAGRALRALGVDQRTIRRTVAAALAGYTHLLRTKPDAAAAATAAASGLPTPADPRALIAQAVQQALAPFTTRLDTLEHRLDAISPAPEAP